MFRAVVWTLRQRRYAAIAVAMLVVAAGCVGAGTFEVHRLREKLHGNAVLRHNAHAAPVPLSGAPVPLVGHGPLPGASVVTYRTVRAQGRYAGETEYVANQIQDGHQGFDVLTPLRTSTGVLLVVRGFVAATSTLTVPGQVAPPPDGPVEVTGWLQPAQTGSDKLGRLGHGEISTINPVEQAARSGEPTYGAYLTLAAGQPGTSGLAIVPLPSLSNPTGGAEVWQLTSYVVQWYAFALLALVAPFLFSRAEVREARRRFLGIDAGDEPFDAPALPALPAASPGGATGAQLAVRAESELATLDDAAVRRWESARRLSDRYGVPLGPDASPELARRARPSRRSRRAPVRDTTAEAHRSADAYHGGYNDYLWELALADGAIPAVGPTEGAGEDATRVDAARNRPVVEGERPTPPAGTDETAGER